MGPKYPKGVAWDQIFCSKILLPWNKFGPMGHLGYLGPMSTKAGPLVFGAQAGLHLPLLESEPTSYGGGP